MHQTADGTQQHATRLPTPIGATSASSPSANAQAYLRCHLQQPGTAINEPANLSRPDDKRALAASAMRQANLDWDPSATAAPAEDIRVPSQPSAVNHPAHNLISWQLHGRGGQVSSAEANQGISLPSANDHQAQAFGLALAQAEQQSAAAPATHSSAAGRSSEADGQVRDPFFQLTHQFIDQRAQRSCDAAATCQIPKNLHGSFQIHSAFDQCCSDVSRVASEAPPAICHQASMAQPSTAATAYTGAHSTADELPMHSSDGRQLDIARTQTPHSRWVQSSDEVPAAAPADSKAQMFIADTSAAAFDDIYPETHALLVHDFNGQQHERSELHYMQSEWSAMRPSRAISEAASANSEAHLMEAAPLTAARATNAASVQAQPLGQHEGLSHDEGTAHSGAAYGSRAKLQVRPTKRRRPAQPLVASPHSNPSLSCRERAQVCNPSSVHQSLIRVVRAGMQVHGSVSSLANEALCSKRHVLNMASKRLRWPVYLPTACLLAVQFDIVLQSCLRGCQAA